MDEGPCSPIPSRPEHQLSALADTEFTFAEMTARFARQMEDVTETHFARPPSLKQARAAVLAARALGVGLFVTLDIDDEGRTYGDCDAAAWQTVLRGMGVAQIEPAIAWSPPMGTMPCSNGREVFFIDVTIDVGEPLVCGPDLPDRILEDEDLPTGAVKIEIRDAEDLAQFAEHQYMIGKPLCLVAATPELLEAALRAYHGRAFYDNTGPDDEAWMVDPETLERLSRVYGLVVL